MPKLLIPQKLLFSVGGLTIAALVLLGLWKIPQRQVERIQQQIEALNAQPKADTPQTIASLEKSKLDAENAARTVLVQVIGGLLVFATGYIGYLNYKTTQEKQVAERFSKAVEQLGSENIHVRLGGIYALEQIAKDAEEKYYWQVMETLTSYVRVKARRSPETTMEAEEDGSYVDTIYHFHDGQLDENYLGIPKLFSPSIPSDRVDIQVVLDVLSRRNHVYKKGKTRPLDLRETDLRGLVFRGNLRGVRFDKANLQGAYFLEGVDLQGAVFRGTKLQRAILNGVVCQNDFLGADLREALLDKTDFFGATLKGTCMQSIGATGAKFKEVDLSDVHLTKANLSGADLQKANLSDAILIDADLDGAKLDNAKLNRANLRGASLKADLTKVEGLALEQILRTRHYIKEFLPETLFHQIKAQEDQSEKQEAKDFTSPDKDNESC